MTTHAKPLPSQKDLHELFDYSIVTGKLSWKPSRQEKKKVAASLYQKIGYWVTRIGDRRYYTHRLIWKWVTGNDPVQVIDHINGDRQDNSWINLRDVNKSQNRLNSNYQTPNQTGYKGVYFHAKNNCFTAQIVINGNARHLGCFETSEEAHLAYCQTAQSYGDEFNRAKLHNLLEIPNTTVEHAMPEL
jgi:hypothetical protein